MAITTAICNSYKQEILQGIHLAADTYKMALIKASPAGTYNKSTTNYSDVTGNSDEVSGTGYSAGGTSLSGYAVSLGADTLTAILTFTSPTWPAATISATGAIIYNSSRSNKALAVFDFGGTITSTADTFTAVIPAATYTTGLIRIS